MKTGILLVNLGTPDSPHPRDVRRYLIEFLTDERVIDAPWLWRQFLVRWVIVRSRYHQSAKAYQAIWSAEGSPLKVHGFKIRDQLQKRMGEDFIVELAMRYQNPSIDSILNSFYSMNLSKILIFPLFPQYSSATTGSLHQKVMEISSKWQLIPEIVFINHYASHPDLIQAFCSAASGFELADYDHVLFSFHGLPQKQIRKADLNGICLQTENCCSKRSSNNQGCYSAQCYDTAHSISKSLKIEPNRYSIAFQSRLGKDPWLQPYTSETLSKLAAEGKKRVLVFCPSFVCDCLETIHEIGVEYSLEFKKAGGEELKLVPGLNDSTEWLNAIQKIINERLLRSI
jgi:protoporphyrin/coproporphyrin ferrochelatase